MESLNLPNIAEELEDFLENSIVDYDRVVREVVKKARIGKFNLEVFIN